MKKFKKAGMILLIFTFGLAIGYIITVYSLFPTCNGNLIFATAPVETPFGNKPTAVVAHLSLIHDMSLSGEHSWYYILSLSSAHGKRIGMKKFSPEMVGGLFNLNSAGNLTWDKDAKAVTVRVRDFVYRYELSQTIS